MRPLRRALFRLAETLHRPVSEIEKDVDSAELSEWIAYWNVNPPFDPWLAMGIVCATVNNCLSTKTKQPRHFIPFKRSTERKQMSAKQMWMNAKAVFSRFEAMKHGDRR